MPGFTKGPNYGDAFGHNRYLRSTRNTAFESYTVAAATVVDSTVDGETVKILKPGTVLAKITSGGESGKVGPFDASATDGRQTAANIVGINDTYLPWQLNHRDVEVGVLTHGHVVQAWCFEYNITPAEVALTNTTADAMYAVKTIDITFA